MLTFLYDDDVKEGFWDETLLRVISEKDFMEKDFSYTLSNGYVLSFEIENIRVRRKCYIQWRYDTHNSIIYMMPKDYLKLKRWKPLPEISDEDMRRVETYQQEESERLSIQKMMEEKKNRKKQEEVSIVHAVLEREHTPLGTYKYISPKNPAYKRRRNPFN